MGSGGRTLPTHTEGAKRFWSKVDKRGPSECWNWTASTMSQGYGCFQHHRTRRASSRWAWIFIHGEIADRCMYVCHRCDNPSCCNPAHLFLGTQGDNLRDAYAKGRHSQKGTRNANAKRCES